MIHHTVYMLRSQINGAEKQVCRELHIAYRYGDHYDSVRRTGDNSESPAQLRIEVFRSLLSDSISHNLVKSTSTSHHVMFIDLTLRIV